MAKLEDFSVQTAAGVEVRRCLVLTSGLKLVLPKRWDESEFTLDSNIAVIEGGQVFALYDAATKTGALWGSVTGQWLILQPCEQTYFFKEFAPHYAKKAGGLLDQVRKFIGE